MKRKILVVDDEVNIVEFLKMNLKQNGYEVICANDGIEAFNAAVAQLPDCILLDIMLPDITGLEVCRLLKQNAQTKSIPIIMLSAKSEENDKVIGLGIGADDYITKPFGLRELFARIDVVLRRSGDLILQKITDKRQIAVQDLEIDLDKYLVLKNGVQVDLTKSEFAILECIAGNREKVTSREELAELLGVNPEARGIDVHILNIRKKLCEENVGQYIETVRGIGFRLKS